MTKDDLRAIIAIQHTEILRLRRAIRELADTEEFEAPIGWQSRFAPRVTPRAGTKDLPERDIPFSPTFGPMETPPTDDPNAPFEWSGAVVRKSASPLGAEVVADAFVAPGSPRDLELQAAAAADAARRAANWGARGVVEDREARQAMVDAILRAKGLLAPESGPPPTPAPAPPLAMPEPLPCEETRRWKMEPGRRDELAKNPLAWIRVAVYYCERVALAQFGDRDPVEAVEDLVRSLEALPGHSDDRVDDILHVRNVAQRAEYTALHAECLRHCDTARAAQTTGLDHDTRARVVLGSPPNDVQEQMAILADKGILPVEGGPTPPPPQDP
jgi:hypothetical protein